MCEENCYQQRCSRPMNIISNSNKNSRLLKFVCKCVINIETKKQTFINGRNLKIKRFLTHFYQNVSFILNYEILFESGDKVL